VPASADGAAPREQQHPQRLLLLSRARQCQRLGRESGSGGADRLEGVVLAAQSPFGARRAAHLEHRLAALAQIADKTGTVVASALNRPDTSAAAAALCEPDRLCVTACVRADDRVRDYGPCRSFTIASVCSSRCVSTPIT
jgi:hypothetical protein